jgi:ABC-type nitrate/sulfonate/bicarbonate transport system substrate-binding protein
LTGLTIGYLPLTDSLPLIAAHEQGIFADFGLNVTLQQEVSWANVRDKLVAGVLDGAQMLAPLPAMTALGVSGVKSSLIYGLVLSRNGNAITLSKTLVSNLNGKSLSERSGPLTLAVVHTFSSHMLLLRRWLRLEGVDPNRDVAYLIMPPSQMPEALATGLIDGFCVGEPWSTVSVEQGLGEIVAVGSRVWPNAPEKVLAVQQEWHEKHPETHRKLREALLKAGEWVAIKQSTDPSTLAVMLSSYLGLGEKALIRSLSGHLLLTTKDEELVTDFHVFAGEHMGRPSHEEQSMLNKGCGEILGKTLSTEIDETLCRETARTDLFDEIFAPK